MYSQSVEMYLKYLDVEPVRYTFHAGQVLAICIASRLVWFTSVSFFSGFLHWPNLHSEPRMFGRSQSGPGGLSINTSSANALS